MECLLPHNFHDHFHHNYDHNYDYNFNNTHLWRFVSFIQSSLAQSLTIVSHRKAILEKGTPETNSNYSPTPICIVLKLIVFHIIHLHFKNGSKPRMCFRILSAKTLEGAPKDQWKLVKYSISIYYWFLKYICQESCEEKSRCTAINWKYEGTHECILRACSLPVVPPTKPLSKWKAYYVSTSTTTTTTTTTSSSTTSPSTSVTYGHG